MSAENEIINAILELITSKLRVGGSDIRADNVYYSIDTVSNYRDGVVLLKRGFRNTKTAVVLNQGVYSEGDTVLIVRTEGDELWAYAPPLAARMRVIELGVEEAPPITYSTRWSLTKPVLVGFHVYPRTLHAGWQMTTMIRVDWALNRVTFVHRPWRVLDYNFLTRVIMPYIRVTMNVYINDKLRQSITREGVDSSQPADTVIEGFEVGVGDRVGFSFDFGGSSPIPTPIPSTPDFKFAGLLGSVWTPIGSSFQRTVYYPTNAGGNLISGPDLGGKDSPFYWGVEIVE